jgi:hypothetical protein
VIGALVAGTLDILYAFVFYYARSGVSPSRILQSVAAGAFGAAAFTGGAGTAAAGLGFHYLNALLITLAFFLAAGRVPGLLRRPVLIGALYGVFVHGVMNYVVIPLSRIGGPGPLPPAMVLVTGVLVHMFCIGVPIAFTARSAYSSQIADR